jgi:hypothetical protein
MTGRQFVVEVSDPFGNVFGRVNNPFDRHFNFVLNGMSTAAFRVPTFDAMARYVAGDALIKIYYGADIVFHGPVTSWERVHEGGKHSIAVTAADPFIYLTKRYLNKTTADVTYANVDRGMLTATFIDQLNAESPHGDPDRRPGLVLRVGRDLRCAAVEADDRDHQGTLAGAERLQLASHADRNAR